MEKEICITYYFNPADYDTKGRRIDDGMSFREVIKGFERDFQKVHSAEYAMNLYVNHLTMNLLAKSCDAAPFLAYGMDLTQGNSFDPEKDPCYNHELDKYSKIVCVYGIDSAFMTEFEENGYPILDEDSEIYPLTLLIDKTMRDGSIRLSTPSIDDNGTEEVIINVPKLEYA